MATALIAQPTNCTLYELEDSLQALVNSIDMAEEPSIRESILEEIGQALRRTKEKRDAVVAFLRQCESQQKFADSELDRIQKRKAFIGRVQEELESYLIQVVEQYATRDRRGTQRLEGNFSSLRIQRNPDSVLISDLEAVPSAFKQVMLTMPAYVWDALLQCLDIEERKVFESRIEKQELKADKKAIGVELKRGTQIPGADLKFGDWRLVIS
jgi:putative lipoic acid-binding regulatory protein